MVREEELMEEIQSEPSPKQEEHGEIIKEELHIRIDELLELQRNKGENSYRNSLPRVPSHIYIKNIGEKHVFEPQLISIGPYHRGKDHLKPMEEIKLLYLNQLLERTGEKSVKRLMEELKKKEQMARECYAASVGRFKQNEFVEMMLLDGCFIIEFIRYYGVREFFGENRHPFTNFAQERLKRDMVLLENQLPFFILKDLLVSISGSSDNLIKMITDSFLGTIPALGDDSDPNPDAKHLLGLVHTIWVASSPIVLKRGPSSGGPATSSSSNDSKLGRKCGLNFLPSATQLNAAGIQFKVNYDIPISLIRFAVEFENGIFYLPELRITDNTVSVFLNLIAYEQSCNGTIPMWATYYIAIMDSLIDAAEDVELLMQSKIVLNNLGDHEEIAWLFNMLGRSLLFGHFLDIPYFDMLDKVNKYRKRRRHRWMASLRLDYFNTPWAWISFLAAVSLLILTMLQTACSIASLL